MVHFSTKGDSIFPFNASNTACMHHLTRCFLHVCVCEDTVDENEQNIHVYTFKCTWQVFLANEGYLTHPFNEGFSLVIN